MLQIFDNLLHYKNIVTVQWIKRLKLCMVTMATLPPAKELKIQVVSWQNEIRTLDVLQSPTCDLILPTDQSESPKKNDKNIVLELYMHKISLDRRYLFGHYTLYH